MGNGTPTGGQGGVLGSGSGGAAASPSAAGGTSPGTGGIPLNMGGMTGAGGTVVGSGGAMPGAGGAFGAGGMPGMGGMTGSTGGSGFGGGGSGGTPGSGGVEGTGGAPGGDGESGRLVGITAAHNAVRAAVETNPPLPPLTWSQTLADYAQEWADHLAMTACNAPSHRSSADLQQRGYGENLAAFASSFGSSSAQDAVDGWASEIACWSYGTISGSEQCDFACYAALNSDGCGHYTQIVWRSSTELGCGVASCQTGGVTRDIWICNYSPAGNYIGQAPY